MECLSEAPPDQPPIDLFRRFPALHRQIESEYRVSEPFRTLCDDWSICAKARERWCSSEAPVAARRCTEYNEWLAELEQEIEEWLKHHGCSEPVDASTRPVGEPQAG